MQTMLFFDDWCLESRHNVEREMGKPEWLPEATFKDDLTKGIYNFPAVYRSPDTGRWYVLYQGVVGVTEELSSAPADVPVLMLAESEDGLHWTKPDLTRFPQAHGRVAPNQVLKHDDIYDRGPAFYDARDADPGRRIKCLCVYEHKGPTGKRVYTQRIAFSPDGIDWNVIDRVWNNWYCSDSPYPIFWNSRRGVYTIMTRPQQAERRIVRIDTPDFVSFEGPYQVLSPDPLDPPLVQHYGLPVFPYEGMFVGFLWMLYGDPYEIKLIKRNGPVDAHLVYSYDGMSFNRTFRTPFVPRNERGQEGGGCIYPTAMVQDDSGNIRIYSGSSHGEHYRDTQAGDAALLVHTLRRDGFMYLESYSHTGRVMTRCLHLYDPLDLSLNVRAPYGYVRVQLSDSVGQALPGYAFEDCAPFRGDEHFWKPQWKGALSQALPANEVARIEVELTNAELYAIRGNFEWMRTPEVRNFQRNPLEQPHFEAWQSEHTTI